MRHSPLGLFMEATLGPDAATALRKAASQSNSIETVLGPRVILGWVKLISRWGHDDAIPGLPGTSLTIEKHEDESLSGEIHWGKHVYDFDHQDVTHVAAALSCALGVDKPVAKSLRDHELFVLGEQVDLLMKTQVLAKAEESSSSSSYSPCVERSPCPGCGAARYVGNDYPELKPTTGLTSVRVAELVFKDEACPQCHKKFEAPGPQAGQNAPSAPQAPVGQTPKSPSRTKKKGFQAKLTMSEATSHCTTCDAPQFQGDILRGCWCLRDLAKHTEVENTDNGYLVTFDSDYWSSNDVAVFLDIVGAGK